MPVESKPVEVVKDAPETEVTKKPGSMFDYSANVVKEREDNEKKIRQLRRGADDDLEAAYEAKYRDVYGDDDFEF